MNQIALTIPGFSPIPNPSGLASKFVSPNQPFLGVFLTSLLDIIFYIAVFLAFYYLIWGAFQYLMAQGNKEELGKARGRITWAIIGLMVVLISYSISQYVRQIFPAQGGTPF